MIAMTVGTAAIGVTGVTEATEVDTGAHLLRITREAVTRHRIAPAVEATIAPVRDPILLVSITRMLNRTKKKSRKFVCPVLLDLRHFWI